MKFDVVCTAAVGDLSRTRAPLTLFLVHRANHSLGHVLLGSMSSTLEQLKGELKSFEREFASAHGRKPSQAEVQARRDIGAIEMGINKFWLIVGPLAAKYKLYSTLKQSSSQPAAQTSPSNSIIHPVAVKRKIEEPVSPPPVVSRQRSLKESMDSLFPELPGRLILRVDLYLLLIFHASCAYHSSPIIRRHFG